MNAAIFDKVTERLQPLAGEASVAHGILVLKVARESLVRVVTALRDDFAFDMFLDVTAVDWPAEDPRFEVVWHFYSTVHHVRIRVKTRVTAADPAVDSLVPLYGSAAFMERECHEMYGIGFDGNTDLRPLLLYEGFTGHPLRKDYPKHREQPLVPYRNTR